MSWNGRGRDLASGTRYDLDISTLRGMGGDVIPSFGSWSADRGGREIADSCKNVDAIASADEAVITKYDVARLDMDVEGRTLTRTDGIDRRNNGIHGLEQLLRHRPEHVGLRGVLNPFTGTW